VSTERLATDTDRHTSSRPAGMNGGLEWRPYVRRAEQREAARDAEIAAKLAQYGIQWPPQRAGES
jgi:hypothetical protein